MSQKQSSFTKGSDNEKRFRLGVCAIGALLIFCLTAVFIEFVSSLEVMPDFFIESAFMVDETTDLPCSFIDELN